MNRMPEKIVCSILFEAGAKGVLKKVVHAETEIYEMLKTKCTFKKN
jgi:hypothetical protein